MGGGGREAGFRGGDDLKLEKMKIKGLDVIFLLWVDFIPKDRYNKTLV